MNRSVILTLVLSAAVFTTVGFIAGWKAPGRSQPASPTADACDRSAASVARRNVFWSIWSGRTVEPFTPDAALAAAVGVILKTGVPADKRNQAIQIYLTKSALYFSDEQMAQAQNDLADGTPAARLAMFRYIATTDLDAARLIGCVLADTARINAFLAGQPVSSETAP